MKSAIKRGRCRFGVVILFIVITVLCEGCTVLLPKEEVPYIEVTVEDTTVDEKFYYEQLSEEEQKVYQEIYQGIIDEQKEVYVHSEDAERVNEIFECVIYDFAEIFWSDGTVSAKTYQDAFYSENYTVVELNYTYSGQERIQKADEIEAVVTEIMNGISADASEYEKIKYVYEYLVSNVSYVEEAPDNQNLYSSLVRKETVCAGYAKAAQYLLNRMGVYCTYVIGTATRDGETQAHAWNIVRCDENYYYVDVTWADPVIEETNPMAVDEMVYDYLCCSEAVLKETHITEEKYNYPQCHLDDLNYYRMNDMFYETVDDGQLLRKLRESIDAKTEKVTFKFADTTLYEQGRQRMLDELMNSAAEYLCGKYWLAQVEYYYVEHPVLHKFTVYWFYE